MTMINEENIARTDAHVDVLAASESPQETQNFLQFSGDGREYFGIWIVNLFLSVITLGVYSAWAKVRRMQYFYRHTTLAGASFDYHGNPKLILKGRSIAFVLFAVYFLTNHFYPLVSFGFLLVLLPVWPFFLLKSLRFRLYNTSYRGLRFRFLGDKKNAYKTFLLWPALTFLTAYLLGPFCHHRLKAYQHNYSSYGQTAFSFHAPVSDFYSIYIKSVVFFFIGAAVCGVLLVWQRSFFDSIMLAIIDSVPNPEMLDALLSLLMVVVVFLLSWLSRPYLEARLQNLIWSNTRLGAHRFVSTLSMRSLLFIQLTNLFGIILTLGLFRPFAVIRLAKYRLEAVSVVSSESLENFAAGQHEALGAIGEEAAEIFNIDISL